MQNNELAMFADFDDALSGAVMALGGWKKVGCLLRPELAPKPDIAAQWVRDCLNPDKRERLNPHQLLLLLRLAREAGYHAAKHWLDSELGYEQGRPLDPTDEQAQLQRDFIAAVQTSKRIAERIERLTQPPLQAVK
jgi:hypothetical protein